MFPIFALAVAANVAAVVAFKKISNSSPPPPTDKERAQQFIDSLETMPGKAVSILSRFEEPYDPDDFLIQTFEVRLDDRVLIEFQSVRPAVAAARALASKLNASLDLEGAYAWKVTGPFGYVREGVLPPHLRPAL